MRRELRTAVRQLQGAPAAAWTLVVILALATAANVAIFSIANGIYLKPPAGIVDADRLVHIYAHRSGRGFNAGLSTAEFAAYRERVGADADMAAERHVAQLHVVSAHGVVEAGGSLVTARYFAVLGVVPQRGTLLSATTPADAVVVSDRLWRTQFGGDAVVGEPLSIAGVPAVIAGIAPPGFHGDEPAANADLWLPITMLDRMGAGCRGTAECASLDEIVARLGHGVAIDTFSLRHPIVWSDALDPAGAPRRQLAVARARGADPDTRERFAAQLPLLAAVTLLLLVAAAANLYGLLLARGHALRRQVAITLALGASRAHVVTEQLLSSLIAGAGGGALGLALSTVLTRALARFYAVDAEGFAHFFDFSVDARVCACAFVVSIAAALMLGLFSAWHLSRPLVSEELTGTRIVSADASGDRLRRVAIVAQIAVAVLLIVSTTLIGRSAARLAAGTATDPRGVVLMRLRPALARGGDLDGVRLLERVRERLLTEPGVINVSFMAGGEGLMWRSSGGDATAVTPVGEAGATITATAQDVDRAFFDSMRVPIRAGRGFSSEDAPGTPDAVVINETLARAVWGSGNAVGRQIREGGRLATIVGVCADLQPSNGIDRVVPHLYRLLEQRPSTEWAGDARLAVRVATDAATALPALRAAVHAVAPAVPLGEDMPMREQIDRSYSAVRLTRDTMVFAVLVTLALCAVGLHAVLALRVRGARREIGIRMALGAHPGRIAAAYVRDALELAAGGFAVGLAAAAASTRVLQAWLYGVSPRDPIAFAGSTILLAVALIAAWLPAREAARVDPSVALRCD